MLKARAAKSLPLAIVVAIAALATASCGLPASPARAPADARTTVVSVRNLDCADCLERLAASLSKRPRVYSARFDRRRAEIVVAAAPDVDALTLTRAAADPKEDYELVAGAGRGEYKAWARVPEGADVQTVSRDGEDVPDLHAVLSPGKVNVVDFGALWCEPCRALDEHMLALAKERADLAYRKLDIGDWDSPLAKRYLGNVPKLPYVIVFARDGRRVDAVAGLDLGRIDRAIQAAGSAK